MFDQRILVGNVTCFFVLQQSIKTIYAKKVLVKYKKKQYYTAL